MSTRRSCRRPLRYAKSSFRHLRLAARTTAPARGVDGTRGRETFARPPGRVGVLGCASPSRPAPDRSAGLTSQGHPHAIFRRAIQAGNVVAAEIAAHELRGLSLSDALDLTALMALRNRDRSRRMAARWLQRWLDETAGVTIDDAGWSPAALPRLAAHAMSKQLDALRAAVTQPAE